MVDPNSKFNQSDFRRKFLIRFSSIFTYKDVSTNHCINTKFFFFSGHHMAYIVPGPGIRSKLQFATYAAAAAMLDP